MTALTEPAPAPPKIDTPPLMVHLEDPHRPGAAWCGAPVSGRYVDATVDCVVCDSLCFHDYLEHHRDNA